MKSVSLYCTTPLNIHCWEKFNFCIPSSILDPPKRGEASQIVTFNIKYYPNWLMRGRSKFICWKSFDFANEGRGNGARCEKKSDVIRIWHIFTFQIFPAVYVIMKSRTRDLYVLVLRKLEEQYGVNPRTVISDFERTLIGATRIVFNRAKITGCLFHYCQVRI